MTARTNRKTTVVIDTDDLIDTLDDVMVDNEPVDVLDVDVIQTTVNKKYMSHAGHDHATKGDAGKAARAQCRRAHRAWFAAELEFLASQESVDIAV